MSESTIIAGGVRRVFLRSLVPIVALTLAGCAATEIGRRQVYSPPPGSGVVTHPSGELAPLSPTPLPLTANGGQPLSAYPRDIQHSDASSAVKALYAQAEQGRVSGKLEMAGNALDRALRLDPRNPFVWNALAKIHLQMQQYDQAENEASKSNSLANGNPWLRSANWRVIAAARHGQGNTQGSLEARARADAAMQGQQPAGQ